MSDPGATGASATLEQVVDLVGAVVRGKREVVRLALTAAVAGGHVLLEDVPGVGKTTLARALAAALGGSFRRIQLTSDLLPADITGGMAPTADRAGLAFREGPLFANVVLADELNRATPRTQSALFEAMAEGQVTVDGESHRLPSPFLVIATQNPHDQHGTHALPESQLDRFLLRLSLGYPDREAERAVLRADDAARPRATLAPGALRDAQGQIEAVRVAPELEDALLDVVAASRADPRLLRGVSPRGARALYRAMRALALVDGRDFVVPDDLVALAVPALAHRVVARVPDTEAAALAALVADVVRGL